MSLFPTCVFAFVVMLVNQDPSAVTTTADAWLGLGRVTGNHVYVRSGPSTNYYPVARVNLGDRLNVLEVKFGWVAIEPLDGTFSLVDKSYVDVEANGRSGVVNADRVWVRAASDLSNQVYAKQVQLSSGQSVQIVRELEELYRIVPPKGARLWISARYVERAEPETTARAAAVAPPEGAGQPGPPLEAGQSAPADSAAQAVELRGRIETIEADLTKELERDVFQRDLQRIIDQFKPVAEQESDPWSHQYASHRIRQLQDLVQRTAALHEFESMATQLKEDRQAFMHERASIRPRPRIERQFSVRGKLLKSFAYDNPAGPRRYRLVDPDSPSPRTIAYVEIEPDSDLDPEAFMGRYVGVRAKSRHLLSGAVEPLTVYTAAEIVVLEPPIGPSPVTDDQDPTN